MYFRLVASGGLLGVEKKYNYVSSNQVETDREAICYDSKMNMGTVILVLDLYIIFFFLKVPFSTVIKIFPGSLM